MNGNKDLNISAHHKEVKKMKTTQLMRLFFLILSKMLSNMLYALKMKHSYRFA
jgi:hypothetical protein